MDGLDPATMLRNVHLNPRDAYVRAAARGDLGACLAALKPRLRQFSELRTRVNNLELEAAVEFGLARPLTLPIKREVVTRDDGKEYRRTTISIRAMERQGLDMVLSRNGVVYGASRKRMPLSKEMLEQERFLALELASCLIRWFESIGALREAESDVLLRQAYERASR